MALGIAITNIPIKNAGGFKFKMVELTYDAAYAVGGYALGTTELGLNAVTLVTPGATKGAGDTGFLARYDYTNSKMMILKAGTADAPFNEGDTNQASLDTLKTRHFVVGY